MPSYNRTITVGNLTRDPELRYIPSGTAICDITIAVNERRKDSAGEYVDQPVFVDVTLWARQAEVCCEYLTKGSPVLIEGRLTLETWEKDGQKRTKLKVTGERLQLLGKKGDGASTATEPPPDQPAQPDEDDIPF